MQFTEEEKRQIAKAWKRLKWVSAFLVVAFFLVVHLFAGKGRV